MALSISPLSPPTLSPVTSGGRLARVGCAGLDALGADLRAAGVERRQRLDAGEGRVGMNMSYVDGRVPGRGVADVCVRVRVHMHVRACVRGTRARFRGCGVADRRPSDSVWSESSDA